MKTIKVERIKPANLIIATILTPKGHTVRVEVDLEYKKALLYQDGHYAGTADVRTWGCCYGANDCPNPGAELECDARLGAPDGSETDEAYESLERIIAYERSEW